MAEDDGTFGGSDGDRPQVNEGELAQQGGEPPPGYREVNRRAWALWAATGGQASTPVNADELGHAREFLDPFGWLPWNRFRTVLCLAAAGGRHAPLFASLGYRVTLVDLSPEQLAIDREVARTYGLDLEMLEGDILELDVLEARHFDLVYQAISACYVPDVRLMYREVSRAMVHGGLYLVDHWNPLQMQLEGRGTWDGSGYRLMHPQGTGCPLTWDDAQPGQGSSIVTWHYIHTLGDLIGGVVEAGMQICRFADYGSGDTSAVPGDERHLAAFAPPFFRILAERS